MRRVEYPVFDEPSRPQLYAPDMSWLVIVGAVATYVIAAVNIWGPDACYTRALTPECAAALAEAAR